MQAPTSKQLATSTNRRASGVHGRPCMPHYGKDGPTYGRVGKGGIQE